MLDDFGNLINVIGGKESVKVEISLPQMQLVELSVYLFIAFLVAGILAGLITRK